MYLNPPIVAEPESRLVTTTETFDTGFAGTRAKILVVPVIWITTAFVPPKVTLAPVAKPVPIIHILSPPRVDELSSLSRAMVIGAIVPVPFSETM